MIHQTLPFAEQEIEDARCYLPSQDEIRSQCRMYQNGWDEKTERDRRTVKEVGWTPPSVSVGCEESDE